MFSLERLENTRLKEFPGYVAKIVRNLFRGPFHPETPIERCLEADFSVELQKPPTNRARHRGRKGGYSYRTTIDLLLTGEGPQGSTEEQINPEELLKVINRLAKYPLYRKIPRGRWR